jgi:hypothetical protein
MNEPEPKSEYWIYRQAIYDTGETGPWESTGYLSDDRKQAEATAERFATNKNNQFADRRNYAVVEVSRKPVRIFPAPMRAG